MATLERERGSVAFVGLVKPEQVLFPGDKERNTLFERRIDVPQRRELFMADPQLGKIPEQSPLLLCQGHQARTNTSSNRRPESIVRLARLTSGGAAALCLLGPDFLIQISLARRGDLRTPGPSSGRCCSEPKNVS